MASVYIRKRDKSYQVVVDMGKDNNGKDIRKYISCKTKKEAEKIKVKEEYNLTTKNYVNPSDMTFGEFYKFWLNDYVKHNCAKTTAITYNQIAEMYIIPELGNIPLQDLSSFHIQRYYSKLIDVYGLSPNTVYKHHANIKRSLSYAKTHSLVLKNVTDSIELPKREEFNNNIYNIEQIQELLKVIKGTDIEVHVSLAVYLGLRRSEIAGLKWEYVDLKNRIIKIREVMVRTGNSIIIKKPKSDASKRDLYIPDELYELLTHHKKEQKKNKEKYGKDYHNSGYVCVYENGKPFSPDKISAKFSRLLKRNNLPHIRLHDLRHSFVTLLIKNGAKHNISIKDISKAAGHSDITTTLKIYAHVLDDDSRDTIKTMSNIISKE